MFICHNCRFFMEDNVQFHRTPTIQQCIVSKACIVSNRGIVSNCGGHFDAVLNQCYWRCEWGVYIHSLTPLRNPLNYEHEWAHMNQTIMVIFLACNDVLGRVLTAEVIAFSADKSSLMYSSVGKFLILITIILFNYLMDIFKYFQLVPTSTSN